MAADMSPSIFILPVMKAVVGLSSPATMSAKSSGATVIVHSASPSPARAEAPSIMMVPAPVRLIFTERSKPEPATRSLIFWAIVSVSMAEAPC